MKCQISNKRMCHKCKSGKTCINRHIFSCENVSSDIILSQLIFVHTCF